MTKGLAGGSSPLTRGKHATGKLDILALRLIPAHAGKTVYGVRHILGCGWLIPAHAGKTSIGCVPLTIPWAHPRSRGENKTGLANRKLYRGSSPLTRGKPLGAKALHGAAGLIPAHAGKTTVRETQTGDGGAHPRSRGENPSTSRATACVTGSSPLTRGKQGRRGRGPHPLGLIPAHAGKTSSCVRRKATGAAHPRSRGENQRSRVTKGLAGGSSPLTRGKPQQLIGYGQL